MGVSKNKYVFVIPCSGIGKSLGTVARKAAYKVVEELRPQHTRIACLPLLTVGDEEILKQVREHPCISLEGCPAKCAQGNVEASNGRLMKSLMVTDTLRRHKELKPEGIIELNPEGYQLANLLAEEVAKAVDAILEDENRCHVEISQNPARAHVPASVHTWNTIVKEKVGIVSCSGEEIPEGTISRIATRLVLEKLRPEEAVTICLPLFLAGDENERAFARVFPTITVDGCEKRCAEIGTKKYSGKPTATIVITDILGKYSKLSLKSRDELSAEEWAFAEKVAEEIAKKVDEIVSRKKGGEMLELKERVKLLPVCAKEAENLNIILPCDGASNVGQIGHQAAVELTNSGIGRMCCITAVGAESKMHLDVMRRAKKIILINGCPNQCAKKILDGLNLHVDQNIVVSEQGVEKLPTLNFKEEDVEHVTKTVKTYLFGAK